MSMELINYKHIPYKLKPNKNKIPVNHFTFEQLEEFNEIYQYAKENFTLVKHTLSQGISNKVSERLHERYFIVKGNVDIKQGDEVEFKGERHTVLEVKDNWIFNKVVNITILVR